MFRGLSRNGCVLVLSLSLFFVFIAQTYADDVGQAVAPPVSDPGFDAETPALADDTPLEAPPPLRWRRTMGPPLGVRRLSPDHEIWIHPRLGAVVVDGIVVFREGPLEMFACPKGTKEHESVVAVFAKAFHVHAALLAVGAEPGKPVQFHPDYKPAEGTPIEIKVLWLDENRGRHVERAQDWVRDFRTRKPLEYSWVFAGSGFWEDGEGNSFYQAEAGDLICVSNFATATLDLPIESTQAAGQLAFEAFTSRIPPLGTHVRLVLTPHREETNPTVDPDTPPPAASGRRKPADNSRPSRD